MIGFADADKTADFGVMERAGALLFGAGILEEVSSLLLSGYGRCLLDRTYCRHFCSLSLGLPFERLCRLSSIRVDIFQRDLSLVELKSFGVENRVLHSDDWRL